MGGNAECIGALRKLLPGKWFIEDLKNDNIPPLNNGRKSVVVVDAASWMYTPTETLGELAKKSVERVNAIAKLDGVEMIFFAHDRKTPSPKYALKTELPMTLSTPLDGADAFFARMVSPSLKTMSRIGTAAMQPPDEDTIVLDAEFPKTILSNRTLKEYVARYICKKVAENASINANQKLLVSGPDFEYCRIGNLTTKFPTNIKLDYLEADYFCSYIANTYSLTHDIIVYSVDTDTVLALLLGWNRIRLPVTETAGEHSFDGLRFKSSVRVVRGWRRAKSPLQYIDINLLWKELVERGMELAQYHKAKPIKYIVTTFVAIMTMCGNDYVRKPPNIGVLKILESFHRHCFELGGPLVSEGSSPTDFKLNCSAMIQLLIFAYNDKKQRQSNFMNLRQSLKMVSEDCKEEQHKFLTLEEMRLCCANTVWFMRYMLAQQTATFPPSGFETSSNGRSIYGYKLTSPTPTRVGWDAVVQDSSVDLQSIDLNGSK